MRPSLVVTKIESRAPEGVVTDARYTGAPSATAGSVTWNLRVRLATFARPSDVSRVLFPVCCASPLYWSQS